MSDDVTRAGPPIDSARLWWFINHQRFPNDWPSASYRQGYSAALDDLAKWLRDGGYDDAGYVTLPTNVVNGVIKSFRYVEERGSLYDAATHRWIDLLDEVSRPT